MRKSLVLLFCVFLSGLCSEIPQWMERQIEGDLQYFKDKEISRSRLDQFYEKKGASLSLVKYEIVNNHVFVHSDYLKIKNPSERIKRYKDILEHLCMTRSLPDTTLLISITDGLNAKEEMPIFAMCKMDSDRIILIPDYESLGARYQVLKYDDMDITKIEFPWENKRAQLIWRGSTAQYFWKFNEENMHLFSRVTLCKLSEIYPSTIDAKFTLFVQKADTIPYLYRFQGDPVSFKEQMNYKYHILIDGNVTAYTKSGWKFFTNSLIFKPDSKWVQWYFQALEPYMHYVPIREDLSDLVDKLKWALENDREAKKIAGQCREFALTHLTFSQDIDYLYELILRYQKLNFVP